MKNPPKFIFRHLGIALNAQTLKKPIAPPQTNDERLKMFRMKKAFLVNAPEGSTFALEVFV